MTKAKIFKIFSFFCLVSVPNTDSKTHMRALFKTRQHHSKNNYNFRVIGGREIREGEYPYVIVLAYTNKVMYQRLCTGSMITNTWGITAAHCFVLVPDTIIQYDNFTDSPLISNCYVPIIKAYQHPAYVDFFNNNDIGVFRSERVPNKPYAVLLPADYSTLIGLPVVYVGAGMTTEEPDIADDIKPLQIGEAIIVACNEIIKSVKSLVVCLAPKCSKRHETSSFGDSGGPLIYDGKVIAVAVFGHVDKFQTSPAYAPISPYIDWIHNLIKAAEA